SGTLIHGKPLSRTDCPGRGRAIVGSVCLPMRSRSDGAAPARRSMCGKGTSRAVAQEEEKRVEYRSRLFLTPSKGATPMAGLRRLALLLTMLLIVGPSLLSSTSLSPAASGSG